MGGLDEALRFLGDRLLGLLQLDLEVLAGLQLCAQIVPGAVAQQAAADVGMVQVAEPQLDERFGAARQADLREVAGRAQEEERTKSLAGRIRKFFLA